MNGNKLPATNPWNEIPLEDYELHMRHATVGQLPLLSALTKKYLDIVKPATALFLGVAGGNGLEHIDNNITIQVTGVDINQLYLDEAYKRYHLKIPSLQLLNIDITKSTGKICSAEFVWAALIAEYTGIDELLQFAILNLAPGGQLVVTIQLNNNAPSVSATGIKSIQKAGTVFTSIGPVALKSKALQIGFTLVSEEENFLPNGKSFLTFHFMR